MKNVQDQTEILVELQDMARISFISLACYEKAVDSALSPTKASLVISKLSQELAILGATLRRLGTIPLYMPRNPSSTIMDLIASKIPLYLYPIPDIVLI